MTDMSELELTANIPADLAAETRRRRPSSKVDERKIMTTDHEVSLAVAQALEMAAKLQDDEADSLERAAALAHDATQRHLNELANDCRDRAAAIRALIPADLAAEAQRQVEDAEKWRKYMRQVEKVKTAMRPQPDDAAIDAARAAK